MYLVGASKKDITCFIKGVGMFGYGIHNHKVKDIETNLYVRTFVIEDDKGNLVALACAEILSCTISIKTGVIEKLNNEYPELKFNETNVMISGTHTHSAPGGYSHYGIYNISVPGFVPEVYETLVNNITESIVEAHKKRTPAKISIGKASFDTKDEVAFNRSIKAYNKNPEIKKKVSTKDLHLALDREMTLLHFEDEKGKFIGSYNWFGVHTTSVGNDLHKICSDNKGYAAEFLEGDIKNKNYVAAFAQAPCGDVSPNFIWNAKRNKMRGKYVDDYKSAKFNGELQYKKAKEIIENNEKVSLSGEIDTASVNINFLNYKVDSEFADGKKGKKTGGGCMGVSFLEGTTDGMGLNKFLSFLIRKLSTTNKKKELLRENHPNEKSWKDAVEKYEIHGAKDIAIETYDRKVLGVTDIDKLPLPNFVDEMVNTFKVQYKSGGLKEKRWAPQVLPIQIITIGQLAIAAVPCEVTTVAGKRMKATVESILKEKGIENTVIAPYSNGFSGYVTTYEEYQVQLYEGGHTMFGEYTLAAYQTELKKLAKEMLKPQPERKVDKETQPIRFTKEDLNKRSFKV